MNPSVTLPAPASGPASVALMPVSRVLLAYYAEAKYEFLKMVRKPAFAVPVLVLPLAMYVLFGVVMAGQGGANNPGVSLYLFCGFTVFGVTGPGILGIGISLALDRDAGLLKLKRALPAPPGAYLLAKLLVAMAFSAITTTSILVAGFLLGKLALPAPQVAALIGAMMLGALPMAAIGLFLGAWATGSAAPAFANLVFLPMMWLSGLFFPLPAFMQKWVVIWPAFYLDQLVFAILDLKAFRFMSPGICVAALAGVTVLFGGLALHRLAKE